MSNAIEPKALWEVEFRSFAPYEMHTPLMHIPVQRTFVRGETEIDARREVASWCENTSLDFLRVERAPEWMQKP